MRAGLVTRELLAEANAESAERDIGLAEALVSRGLSEDALAGYMLADGHGPLLEPRVLASPERACAERVGRKTASALLALPVRQSTDGVIVAMADPSDEAAIGELHSILASPIVAKVARVAELRAAIVETLGEPTAPDSDEAKEDAAEIPLVRPRSRLRRAAALEVSAPVPFALPDDEVEDQSWTNLASVEAVTETGLSTDEVEPTAAATPDRPEPPPPAPAAPPGDIGVFLASLRAADSRDEALVIACEAALTVGGAAVFLGLRKGVLVGWEGLGPGVSREALRNLWIPATTESVFKRVLASGKPHHGPHGAGPADQLFRAATGCRGAKLGVHAVQVGSKQMGVLCVDDPRHDESGKERLAVVAHALGEALKRLILARKP